MPSPNNVHLGSPDATSTAVNLGNDFPTSIDVKVGDEVKKVPVTYIEKLVLKTGRFIHPGTREEFRITPAFLDELTQKTNQMIAAGIEIPTPTDHLDHHQAKKKNPYFVKAVDNLGFVVRASREGDCMKFVQAVIGEDAALTAIRNRCSVYLKPFTDVTGKDWGTAIVHSAYTPIPVMHGLGAPIPLSREEPVILELSREEETGMNLSEAQKKRLIAIAIKNGKTEAEAKAMTDAQLQEQGVLYLEKLPDGDPTELKRELDEAKTTLATKTTELTSAQSRETELKQKLAKEEPEAPKPREVAMAKKGAVAQIDGAVAQKKFSPATGDLIKAKIEAEPLRLVLGREDDDEKPELFETLIEVASSAAATPIPGKEEKPTKEKKLSRETPPNNAKTGENEEETEEEKNTRIAREAGEKFRKNRRAPVLSGQSNGSGAKDE